MVMTHLQGKSPVVRSRRWQAGLVGQLLVAGRRAAREEAVCSHQGFLSLSERKCVITSIWRLPRKPKTTSSPIKCALKSSSASTSKKKPRRRSKKTWSARRTVWPRDWPSVNEAGPCEQLHRFRIRHCLSTLITTIAS